MIPDVILNALIKMPADEAMDIIERKGMIKNLLKELRARRDNAAMFLSMEEKVYK